MTVAPIQCPHCHQSVPANAQVCPHCGIYLRVPDQSHPVALLGVAQTPASSVPNSPIVQQMAPASAPLSPVATAQSLPEALKQIDASASTNLTISGGLIAFYSGAIFAGKVAAPPFSAFIYALPVILLLITMILSLRVFYPGGYLTDDYPKLFRTKDARLRHSSLLLQISVGFLAVAVFVYLTR
ncbi:MAG TPA: zinc ribbon domain-containing protein [Ktedonobacteraceae bacterium]